jgi:hypothetical protein
MVDLSLPEFSSMVIVLQKSNLSIVIKICFQILKPVLEHLLWIRYHPGYVINKVDIPGCDQCLQLPSRYYRPGSYVGVPFLKCFPQFAVIISSATIRQGHRDILHRVSQHNILEIVNIQFSTIEVHVPIVKVSMDQNAPIIIFMKFRQGAACN